MVMDKQVTQVSLFACMGPLNDTILAHPQQKKDHILDCESTLLQPIFTFLVGRQPLAAVVIIMATKEEVTRLGIKSTKAHIGGRMGMNDSINQAQDFNPGDHSSCPMRNQL